jgi:hypothetical protein
VKNASADDAEFADQAVFKSASICVICGWSFGTMNDMARSARAVMVSDGFTPGLADIAMRGRVESKPRSTDHPKLQRAVGRPKMHLIVSAVAKAADVTAAAIRATRGGMLRRLAPWIGWHEGLVTLRSIAASLRLRSEGTSRI